MSHYIGKITIQSLRDYILDTQLSEEYCILLNQIDFDNIILEYREFYRESIKFPFRLLDVLIREDDTFKISAERIDISYENNERFDEDELDSDVNLYDPIYRCGWCGNIVNYNGDELSIENKGHKIGILKRYPNYTNQQKIDGFCCKNRS